MEVDPAGGGGGRQIAPSLMQSLMLWLITAWCRVGEDLCLSQLTWQGHHTLLTWSSGLTGAGITNPILQRHTDVA